MFENGFPRGWSTFRKLALLFRAVVNAVSPVLKTATGNPIHVTDALRKPAVSLTAQINCTQSGSGDPSPDNIRPISGFTGLTVTRTGKNLFNKNGVTAGYALDAQGSEVENANFGISDYIKIDTNKITVSGVTYNNAAWSLRVHAYDSGMTWISQIKELYVNSASVTDTVINVPAGVSYIRMSIGIVNRQNLDTLMVEYGATVSAYEPFGASYPVSWQSSAGTVYGGTLDVVSGLLTVTMVSITLNGSESGIRKVGYTNVDAFSFDNVIPANQAANQSRISFADRFVRGNVDAPNHFSLPTAKNIACSFEVGTFADLAAFKTYCSANPIQVVYTLATPQTYQLTAAQITILAGDNSLWTDASGDLSLSYYADGNASPSEALGILLGSRYVNNHGADEPTDAEALDILLGGNDR